MLQLERIPSHAAAGSTSGPHSFDTTRLRSQLRRPRGRQRPRAEGGCWQYQPYPWSDRSLLGYLPGVKVCFALSWLKCMPCETKGARKLVGPLPSPKGQFSINYLGNCSKNPGRCPGARTGNLPDILRHGNKFSSSEKNCSVTKQFFSVTGICFRDGECPANFRHMLPDISRDSSNNLPDD